MRRESARASTEARKFREHGSIRHFKIYLEEEDESDGLGDFDEDMEIFAPEEREDVEAPPWWKMVPSVSPVETELLLAYTRIWR